MLRFHTLYLSYPMIRLALRHSHGVSVCSISLPKRSPAAPSCSIGVKQNNILATDQRYFHARTASQVFIEMLCRVQPGEAAAGDDYFALLHF
ncbi:MAG TPA: hypothetical protein VFH87_13115 [Candidatus Udaeobacter sp.]|nr:hypothetical protein [Candidatus Udaeobacter sp.]